MEKLALDKNPDLQPEEQKLLQHIIRLNKWGIAFAEDERRTFQQDYFSNYQMLIIEHKPWKERNIPLPPGY